MTAATRSRRAVIGDILDGAHAAAAAIEGHRLADPLTGPRPAHIFDTESEPIYAALVAEYGAPGQDHITAGPVVVGELATQAIDMSELLAEAV